MAQKIAVITGSPRGDTPMVAQRLLERGFALVIRWTRDADEAAALVGRLQKSYRSAVVVHVDGESADVP